MSNESKPLVKWRISKYRVGIERYEILRETENFYVVHWDSYRKNNERREQKDGTVFDTWEDAKAALVRRCQQTVENIGNRLALERANLRLADSLTKPEDE